MWFPTVADIRNVIIDRRLETETVEMIVEDLKRQGDDVEYQYEYEYDPATNTVCSSWNLSTTNPTALGLSGLMK